MTSVAFATTGYAGFGGEWYRAVRPAMLLGRKKGWYTGACDKIAPLREGCAVALGIVGSERRMVPGVVVVRPVRSWRAEYTEHAHAAGQIVLGDLDDNVWGGFKEYETPDPDDYFEEWLPTIDGLLVSTEPVRAAAAYHLSCPIVLAPNCYDPWAFIEAKPQPGRVLGTRLWIEARRGEDLDLYRELFLPLLSALDLTWLHIGAEHRSFRDEGWPDERLVELPSAPIQGLWRGFQRISIGCIAIGEHVFNEAKTETHAVELAAAGVPIVAATRHPLYKGRVPGCVEPTPEAVRERVERLLDPDYWRRESHAARRWAHQVSRDSEKVYLRGFDDLLRRSVVHSAA